MVFQSDMFSFPKVFFILVCFLAPVSELFAERTLIWGKVSGGVKPEITLRLRSTFSELVPEEERTRQLNAEGEFRFELDISQPHTGTLTYRNMEYVLFLLPGDSLFYEFSFSDTRMSSSFSGRGEGNNTAYLLIRQEFEQLKSTDEYLAALPRNTTPFAFERSLQKEEQRQLEYLETMSDMQLSPVYVNVEKNNIRYGNALLRHNFFMGYTLDNGGRYEDYWAQSVEQVMRVYPVESPHEDALFSPMYREYLKLVLLYLYQKENTEGQALNRNQQIERKWKLVGAHFPRNVRDYLYAYLILSKYPDNTRDIHTVLDESEYAHWQDEYRKYARSTYVWTLLENERHHRYGKNATAEVVTPESLAAITFLEEDQSALETFTDFVNKNAGNVILVDFWASWCQPCLAVAPQVRELQSEYRNENIVFLFVSFDKNREKWRKMVWKLGFQGAHLLGEDGFKSDLAQQFGIQALPHYMLINKEGQITFLNAASPADAGQLRNQINTLLY